MTKASTDQGICLSASSQLTFSQQDKKYLKIVQQMLKGIDDELIKQMSDSQNELSFFQRNLEMNKCFKEFNFGIFDQSQKIIIKNEMMINHQKQKSEAQEKIIGLKGNIYNLQMSKYLLELQLNDKEEKIKQLEKEIKNIKQGNLNSKIKYQNNIREKITEIQKTKTELKQKHQKEKNNFKVTIGKKIIQLIESKAENGEELLHVGQVQTSQPQKLLDKVGQFIQKKIDQNQENKLKLQSLSQEMFRISKNINQINNNLAYPDSKDSSRLTSQISVNNPQRQKYQRGIQKQLRGSVQDLKLKIESVLNSWKNALTENKLQFSKQKAKLEKENQNLKGLNDKNSLILDNDNQKISKLESDLNKKSQELINLKRQLEIKKQQLKKSQSENDKNIKELNQVHYKLKQLQNEKFQLSNQIQQSKRQITQKDNKIKDLNRKLNHDLENVKYIQKKSQENHNMMSETIKQNNQKIFTLSQQNEKLRQDFKVLQDKFKLQQQKSKDKNEQFTRKISQLETKIKVKQQDLQQARSQSDNLRKQIEQLTSQINVLNKRPTYSRPYLHYFTGNILNQTNEQDLKWLVDQMEINLGRKMKSTKFLYRFDLKNDQSFHHYIDLHPHIVLLIKMENGNILAAYSEVQFRPKTNVDFRTGMMFSFFNRKVFHSKREQTNKLNRSNPRPITYDDYFIIWGNSDIRIKSGTKELYSNYATIVCCYEEKGNNNPSVMDLFVQDCRDSTLVDFQFFKINFEGDY